MFLLAVILSVLSWGMLIAEPAPATRPDAIAAAFQRLGDRDPDVREQARIELMGLHRSKLDALRAVVEKARFVSPEQASVLRDIVVHVYMAGEPQPPDESPNGFLGVRIMLDTVAVADEQEQDASRVVGIGVEGRFPGFCAFRMLRDGDVIVGVEEHPRIVFNSREVLQGTISMMRPGQTIHLRVQRGGQTLSVPVTLDARPREAQGSFELLLQERLNRAEEYWQRAFVPLLEQPVS